GCIAFTRRATAVISSEERPITAFQATKLPPALGRRIIGCLSWTQTETRCGRNHSGATTASSSGHFSQRATAATFSGAGVTPRYPGIRPALIMVHQITG